MTPTQPDTPESILEGSLPLNAEVFHALNKAWKIRREYLL